MSETNVERLIKAVINEHGEEVFISAGYGAGDMLAELITSALATARQEALEEAARKLEQRLTELMAEHGECGEHETLEYHYDMEGYHYDMELTAAKHEVKLAIAAIRAAKEQQG